MNIRILYILLIITLMTRLSANNDIDSLVNELHHAKHDSARIKLTQKIFEHYLKINTDTALHYAMQGQKLADALKNNHSKATFLNKTAIVYFYKSVYDSAIYYWQEALKMYKALNNSEKISACYNNIGLVYHYQDKWAQAHKWYIKSLKMDKKMGDEGGAAQCLNNIGLVNKSMKNYQKAMNAFEEAIQINKKLGNKRLLATNYNNVGLIYLKQFKTKNKKEYLQKAIDHFHKALTYYQKKENSRLQSACYNNLGECFAAIAKNSDYDKDEALQKALLNFHKSLKIDKKLGDKNSVCITLGNIAHYYLLLSSLNHNRDNSDFRDSALIFGHKAYRLSKEINSFSALTRTTRVLHNTYQRAGDFKKAYQFAEQHIEAKDSLFSKEKTKALTEMQVKYEAEKKKIQIEKLQKEKVLNERTIALQKVKANRQLIAIISAILFIGLLAIFIFIVYRMLIQKRKANQILLEQNHEISQQKEEINTQRDELEKQKNKTQEQKEQIEALYQLALERKAYVEQQKKAIDDSIAYAQKIQSAVLPTKETFNTLFSNSFIFFKPKDVVSGDFYWASHSGSHTIFCVVDCTGHGVPGAFMSILGLSFLNDIIKKNQLIRPDLVLNTLRKNIIESLKQQTGFTRQTGLKDGMDMALCNFNTSNKELQYAGAHNSIYIVRLARLEAIQCNSKTSGNEYNLYELKGNKMPIGIHHRQDPFTLHTIQLKEKDRVFLFSDGITDQFGGPKGKKFKTCRLKELILATAHLRIDEQEQKITNQLNNWINKYKQYDQIDDMTLLGIEF